MNRISMFSLAIAGVFLSVAPSALRGQTETVDVNGVSLPYEIRGEGPPLVLIHGWAVHRGFWDDDVELLARRHTVIRYDRRGFGGASGKPDITADPADLKELLATLGVDRAHIMGHSQGTAVALTFAVRYPGMVRSLILFGPGILPGQELPVAADFPPFAEWVAIGQREGVDSLRAAIGAWGMRYFGGDVRGWNTKAADLLSTYSGDDLLSPAQPLNLVELAGVTDLADVTVPTLIIHGEHEMSFIKVTANLMADSIPGAERVVIPGGGHVVNWQEPERFADAVLRFIRHVEETGG